MYSDTKNENRTIGAGIQKSPNVIGGIRISPHTFIKVAALTITAIISLNVVANGVYSSQPNEATKLVAQIFMVDRERNIPTFFSFGLIVCNAFLLAVLAIGAIATHNAWRWHWSVLTLIFSLMAFDEAAVLHEKLNIFFRPFVPDVSVFRFAWVVPGAAFVMAFGLVMLPFLRAFGETERLLVILSGAVFVGGALGVELVGSAIATEHGMAAPSYFWASTLEEALEMAGMALFGYALLRMLAGPDGLVALPRSRV